MCWILSYQPDGEWNRAAETMMLQFAASAYPVFRGTSPLSRGTLDSKGGGKTSIHYNAEPQTVELQLRTIMPVNQLTVYGAVPKWINDECQSQGAEPQVEEGAVHEVPPQLVTRLTKHKSQDKWARRGLVRKRDERLEKLTKTAKLTQVCQDARSTRTVAEGQFSLTRSAIELEGQGITCSCRGYTCPRDDFRSFPKI